MLGQINCLPFNNYLAKFSHFEFLQSRLKRWTCLAHDLSLGMWEPDFQQVKTLLRDDVFKVCIRKPFKKRKMKHKNLEYIWETTYSTVLSIWWVKEQITLLINVFHRWILSVQYFCRRLLLNSSVSNGWKSQKVHMSIDHRCHFLEWPWRKRRPPHGFHVLLQKPFSLLLATRDGTSRGVFGNVINFLH